MTKSSPLNDTPKKFLSVREFADTYGIGLTNTYAILKSGAVTAVKLGKLTRIRVEDADRWATSLPIRGV